MTPLGERSSRFGDWTLLKDLCESGKISGARPFYAGPLVDSRMGLIRQAINDMRARWGEYPSFMENLRNFMQAALNDDGRHEVLDGRAEALFSARLDWADTSSAPPQDGGHHAISLYTSHLGYNRMFGTINAGLRRDDMAGKDEALRAAVFLIELLTIDLFNYCRADPAVDRFEGHVYRGMCVSTSDRAQFLSAMTGPIEERYVAIPLAMMSTSTQRDTALEFALRQADVVPGGCPILWDVHTVGVQSSLLDLYAASFPTSVVSTICAVPIGALSDFPNEQEVLLRGPFFQLLGMRSETRDSTAEPLLVLDMLMLTANRDHVSSIDLSEPDTVRARELFRTIVAAERARHCLAYAEEHELADDAVAYERQRSQQWSRLETQ